LLNANNAYKLLFFSEGMNKDLEYKIFKKNLTLGDMAIVTCMINDSENFELDELSHIILNGTNTRVGYIGDDTLELVNPNNKLFKEYHNKLKEIFNYEFVNHY